jgi:transposase
MWKKYDEEFKRNALQKVFDGQSVISVSQELGVNESIIHKWKRAALKNGGGTSPGKQLSEIEALKKRNWELETEVEILKRAALIFGRGVKTLCFY